MADNFNMNPNFERDVQRMLREKVQTVLDAVSATHSNSSQSEVRQAIIAAAEREGIQNFQPPDNIVEAISEGRPARAL